MVERLGTTEVHVRQVAGGAVLRPLSARRLSGASVGASSDAATGGQRAEAGGVLQNGRPGVVC
jgi:hypothetical protein